MAAGKRARRFYVPLAYLVLALFFTWPVIIRPFQHVISEYIDIMTAFYNFWWFHQAVCEVHASPWTNTLIDYPYGFSMALFPMWIPYDILGLPFVEFLGPGNGLPAAFNFVTIVSFVASGVAGYLLVKYLTGKPWASFVAGLALAAAPYRFWNLTRMHVSCLELLAFLIYFFLRTVREDGKKPAIGFVITATLLCYTSPPYTADMVIALALAFVFMAFTERDRVLSGKVIKRLAISSAAVVVLCSPFLIRVGTEMIESPEPALQPEELRIKYSANLAGFVTPGFNLTAYSPFVAEKDEVMGEIPREHGIMGYEVFAGYVVLVLAGVGIFMRWKKSRLFVLLFFVFALMSLGPDLHAGGDTIKLSMPYEWLRAVLPWLRFERAPVRHFGPAYVALVALVGIGLGALSEKIRGGKGKALIAAAGVLIAMEFMQAPLDLDRFPLPGFVGKMQEDPKPGSVLDLPQVPDIQRIAGWYHMHHWRPLVFQLTTRGDDPEHQETAIYRAFHDPSIWLHLSGKEYWLTLTDLRQELGFRDVRYIVVYPRFMDEEDLAGLRKLIPELGPDEKLVDNDKYIVYRFSEYSEDMEEK